MTWSSRLNNTVSVSTFTAGYKPEEIVLTELPAELGGKNFNNTSDGNEGRRELSAKGKVTSCKKAINGKWFFIFDNGPVWKHVGSSRRNYRECNFLATIERDGIGFKMTV